MSPPQIIRGHVGDMVGYSTVYTSIRMQWMWCMVILVQSNTIRPISGRFLDDGDVGMSNRTRLVWSLVVVSSKSLGMSNRTRLVTFLQVAGFQPYQDLLSSATDIDVGVLPSLILKGVQLVLVLGLTPCPCPFSCMPVECWVGFIVRFFRC